ncbi:MAG: type II secretion system F family protein [Candidatus Omnitrophota bacterium]
MPYFRYVARDKTGILKDEVMEAMSKEDLINTLQASGLYIVSVGAVSDTKRKKETKVQYHRGVNNSDLIMFARELAILLGSGVTLIKSLEVLSKQIQSVPLFKAVEKIKKDIEGGYTFQNALRKHKRIFSDFWVNLVETGEASGHLPLSLDRLSGYLESSEELRKKIVSALVYPTLLVSVSLAALAVFFLKVIPIFTEIFHGFNVDLPLLTRMIIMMSEIVRKFFFLVIVAGIVGGFIIKKYISTEIGRYQFDLFKLKMPMIGVLTQEIATERFTSGLATLLKSGVPILHALEISEKIVSNKVMERELRVVKTAVRDGKAMYEIMQEIEVFSPLVVQMIGVGEEIGELGEMLDKISSFYKERITTFVARFTTLFEPIVLISMGFVVGVLVISMFMPIFSISTAVRAGS